MSQETKSNPIKISKDRRTFLGALTGLSVVFVDKLHGKNHYALSCLWDMDPTSLSKVKPMFKKECKILVKNNDLYVARSDKDKMKPVIKYSELVGLTYRSFNGRISIGEIVENVMSISGMEQQKAFNMVREVFLKLVEREICVPNPRSEKI